LTTEKSTQKNRDAFPFAAQMLDELRDAGFIEARVVWAEENGKQVGKKGPDGVRPVIERKRQE
jgi:hypothetical protein